MKKEKELNTLISTKTFHFYILIDSHLVLFFYKGPALLVTLTPVASNNCSDDDNSNNYDDCDNCEKIEMRYVTDMNFIFTTG